MSFRKSIFRLGALSVAAWLSAQSAGLAQKPVTFQVPVRMLSAVVKNEAPPGAPPYYSIYVTCGTNQMAFGLPVGYRLSAFQEKILLVNGDNTSFLTFRVLNPAFGRGGLDSDACRKVIMGQYSGAKILDEFASHAGNYVGKGFSLQWLSVGGAQQSICMAFVPTVAGVLEIGLVTTPQQMDNDSTNFRLVMASLRMNDQGEMKPATPPGNS